MLRDRLFAGGGALSRSIPARTPPLSPPRCVVAATLGVCDRTVRRLTPAAICPRIRSAAPCASARRICAPIWLAPASRSPDLNCPWMSVA